MHMETNDPKETADDTTITEDWQDPDFGGYPIEDDDDWPSTWCSFFLNMSKRYNHAFSLEFEVESDRSCQSEDNSDYPTEQEMLYSLCKRITSILDPDKGEGLLEVCNKPFDTFMND